MDLESGDAPAGPQKLELSTLDIEEVEEVAGCEEQRVLVQNMKVVTTCAVVAKAVGQSQALGAEMSRDVRGVVYDNFLLLLACCVREPLHHTWQVKCDLRPGQC